MPKIKLLVKQLIKDLGGATYSQNFYWNKVFDTTTAKHKQNVEQADAKPKKVKISIILFDELYYLLNSHLGFTDKFQLRFMPSISGV